MKRKSAKILSIILACSMTFTNIYALDEKNSDVNTKSEQKLEENKNQEESLINENKILSLSREDENDVEKNYETENTKPNDNEKEKLISIIESLEINQQQKNELSVMVSNSDNKEMIQRLNSFFEKFQRISEITKNLENASSPVEMKKDLDEINSVLNEIQQQFDEFTQVFADSKYSKVHQALGQAVAEVKEKLKQKQDQMKMIEKTVQSAMKQAQSSIKNQIEQKQYEAKRQVQDKIEEAQKDANDKMTDAKKQINEEVKNQVSKILEDAKKQINEEVKRQVEAQLEEAKKQIAIQLLNFKSDSEKEIEEKIGNIMMQITGKKIPKKVKMSENFSDVPLESWYSKPVEYVYKKGIMKGFSDGKFHPEAPVTKAMLLTMLYKMEKSPKIKDSKIIYKDLNPDNWYYESALWAGENMITKDENGGKFTPNNVLTRKDAVNILYRYKKMRGEDTSSDVSLKNYTDFKEESKESKDAMKWALSKGIISKTQNFKLSPNEKITRSQIAKMIKEMNEGKML